MNTLFVLVFIAAVNAAQCDDGTYWDQEAKTCQPCPLKCATCWSATKCTSCVSKEDTTNNPEGKEYIIDSTYKCVEKVKVTNCKTHDGNNCVECEDTFYLQGNACHPCEDMGVPNCAKCNMNKCFKCGKDTNDKQLTLYEEEDGTQTCIDCSSPENDEKCGRCPLGKYFNTTTFQCTDCREDCRRCTTGDNCYLCAENLALADPADPLSVCQKIANCTDGHYYGNHCELCDDGYFVRDGYCVPCGEECTRCVDEMTCVECNQGATLKEGNCTKVEHCKRSSDLIGCLECESGYYLESSACLKCADSCATCKSQNHCFTCKANYYFTDKANGVCSPMDATTCDVADQYGCLHCKSEIPYSTWKDFKEEKDQGGKITQQIKDAADADLKKTYDDATAQKASIGYYLPYTYNNDIDKVIYEQECKMCAPGCRICEHNAEWCTACNDNYQMIEDEEATKQYQEHFGTNTTIYKCKNITETCEETTMGYCTKCRDPNFLNGMECISCHESCSSCVDNTNCQSCNSQDTVNGHPKWWRPKALNDKETMAEKGACMEWELNITAYYLDKCASTSSTGCSSCVDGYYRNVNWGGCKKCPSKCVSCELKNTTYESTEDEFMADNSNDENFADQFKCTACKAASEDGSEPGEVLNDDGECLKCNTIPHCIKCNGKDMQCDACETNYERQSDGTCAISDLVIAVPIASVVAVIIIIIIIIVIILIWRKIAKDRKEREKEIKPFKVSNEVEMALLSADNENFPLKTGTWDLDFGLKREKAKIDEEYVQTVQIMNGSKKSYFFEVLSGASHRYDLTADPQRATLKPGYAIEVKFTIKMLCTAVVKDEIGIVAMDMDEDSKETAKLTIKIESDLSMKLDHTELKLEMPAIGEGAFGMVFRGTYRGQKVAVKKMKARNLTEEQEKEFKHEVNMLTQYRHATVVNLIGAVYTEGEVSIVTEFADHGSLSKVWKKEKISYDLKVKFMEDSVVALAYLHENQIIHRDVKGENVLVYSLNPHSPVCGKLTDFGTCRNISERALQTKELTTGIGTPTYMAPECLGNNKYDIRADVYSFGIVLYETYIERNAYDDDQRFNQPWMIPQFVIEGKRLDKPEGIPNDYWGLVEQCWQQEPDNRPSFPQVYATLAALDNVNILHTEMSNKAEALDVGGAGNNNNNNNENNENNEEVESSSESSNDEE